ncbi:hypothetical protein KR100_06610 [Synechococcus sp. KORDI-100]|uniref:hypothetical protein n=1 Tax=Synechococcus sp. KORDI-100 TaxID=1280380 RepID=UPI0004E06CA2|nr:hypothetical protein [Synechococcus sp. KORDI-100]AII43036.1 hypothetical protein KR100_06610 [Synechococcus sp. KORDI-100]
MRPDHKPTRQASFRLQRDDGGEDAMTRRRFSSYDEAYDALEQYCGAFCCSDDDQIEYSIKANETNPEPSAN